MKKIGLNVSRSKKAMYESFFKLVKKKDFSEISVQDILEDCGYSRSCFYHNFEDKYNMLTVLVQDEAKAYIDHFVKGFSSAKKAESKDEIFTKAGISAFEFVYSEKEFYEALVSGRIPGHGKDSFFKVANEYFVEIASYPVEKIYPDINISLYISSMTAIIGSFIEFWVRNNFKQSPEYMEQQLMLFFKIVNKADFVDV